jgi:hypothetical protein
VEEVSTFAQAQRFIPAAFRHQWQAGGDLETEALADRAWRQRRKVHAVAIGQPVGVSCYLIPSSPGLCVIILGSFSPSCFLIPRRSSIFFLHSDHREAA